MTQSWDVIVVGAGTAGLPVAIQASQRGARVLVVEASDRIGGTLHFSSGSFSAAGTSLQKQKGIDDTPERHFKDGLRINHGTGNHRLMRKWMDNAAEAFEWLMSIGLKYPDTAPVAVAGHEPYDAARICTPKNQGIGYIDVLKPAFEAEIAKGHVQLRLNTEMLDLVVDQAKRVQGIKIKTADGRTEDIHGRNVVLACGGYAYNEAMWREFHQRPRRVYCNPFSMGKGIEVARKYGAQMEGADELICTFGGTMDLDDPNKVWINTKSQPGMRQPWEIFVNLKGERFMAEDNPSPDWRERAIMGQDDWVCWCIYDQSILDKAPAYFIWPAEKVERAFATNPNYRKAKTLDELAQLTSLPAQALKDTVKRYNAGQAAGSDAFGRTYMPAPIGAAGPFYAVKLFALSVVSFGGITVDTDLRVLDGAGTPIGNLYAVGEMLGMGIFGNAYLGGSSVSGALTLGRLLGAKILNWSSTGAMAAE